MISRALVLFFAACGACEPAHAEVAVAPLPSASSSAPSSFDHPVETSRTVRPPSDRNGTMTVNGRLPPEIIQRALQPNMPRLLACNPKATSTDDRDAVATVRFVIGRQGDVASVKLDDSSNVPDPVSACVTAIFQSLQFPAPEGGIVTVVYPLFFHTP